MTEKNDKSLNFNVVSAIILDPKNRILLQKKDSAYYLGPNKWSLFGGGIEKDETAEEAIRREIGEELNILVRDLSFFENSIYEGVLGDKKVRIPHKTFIIKFDGNLKEIKLGEGAGFALFEKKELENLDMMPPTMEALKRFTGRF